MSSNIIFPVKWKVVFGQKSYLCGMYVRVCFVGKSYTAAG